MANVGGDSSLRVDFTMSNSPLDYPATSRRDGFGTAIDEIGTDCRMLVGFPQEFLDLKDEERIGIWGEH